MARPPEEDIYFEFFKAKHTTRYLETYVDHQKHAGKTLRDRIKFEIEVQSLLKMDSGWIVSAKRRVSGEMQVFRTVKLVIASGLTSIPNMPSLPGRENFEGPILHQEDFGASSILSNPDVQKIVVLGGGKSSADMVYAAVKAGKAVNWVLKRTDTTGPGFFLSPKGIGPYKNAFEIGMTRLAATFTPSFLNGDSWWTKFLHSTSWGMKLMKGFWNTVDKDARKDANFGERHSLQGFEKLSPHSPYDFLPRHYLCY
jgi:dimethylaniline monooxygenase (N-oxide forming)